MVTTSRKLRKAAIETPIGSDVLLSQESSIKETSGGPLTVDPKALSLLEDIHFEDLLDENATAGIEIADDRPPNFSGHVSEFSQTVNDGDSPSITPLGDPRYGFYPNPPTTGSISTKPLHNSAETFSGSSVSSAIDNSTRINFLDPMRSIFMMLGVLTHTAQVYNPESVWHLKSDKTSDVALWIITGIHTFRMPAFFIIAGFFCLLAIKKCDPFLFMKRKLKRILIPLVTTALTLNLFHTLVLVKSGWYEFDWHRYIFEGAWYTHLWFLVFLTIYFLLSGVAARYCKISLRFIGSIIDKIFASMPMIGIVALMPFATLGVMSLNKIGFPLYSNGMGLFNTYELLYQFIFFAFGVVLANNRALLFKFASIKPVYSIFLISISMAAPMYIRLNNQGFQEIFNVYFLMLGTWGAITLCFSIFYRFFNTPSGRWRFLSEASYTVFLFHYIFVIYIGNLFIEWSVSPGIGMLTMVVVIGLITLGIHKYIILKVPPLRLMYNGK